MVPKPSTVTASRSAKRIRVKDARDGDDPGTGVRPGSKQAVLDDAEAAGANRGQMPRRRVLPKLLQGRAALRRRDVVPRVESAQLARIERPGGRGDDASAAREREHLSLQAR